MGSSIINHPFIFFFLVAFLFAASCPTANGQSQNVTGRICCTFSGECTTNNQGVSDLSVTLICVVAGFPVTIGQTTTDTAGAFAFYLPSLQFPGLPSTPPCFVFVPVSAQNTVCPILGSGSAYLISVLGLSPGGFTGFP